MANYEIARAEDARSIRVLMPDSATDRVALISQIEELEITRVADPARVIINSRTGAVVMNQEVRVDRCAITHGGISLTIDPNANPEDTEANGVIKVTNSGANLAEVVRALNSVGTSPQDLVIILQSMKSAGALRATLEII